LRNQNPKADPKGNIILQFFGKPLAPAVHGKTQQTKRQGAAGTEALSMVRPENTRSLAAPSHPRSLDLWASREPPDTAPQAPIPKQDDTL